MMDKNNMNKSQTEIMVLLR